MQKSPAAAVAMTNGSCSFFNNLPDEIVLQIIHKLTEFKTQCVCKLISRRFYSIVHQLDTVSFTASSLVKPHPPDIDSAVCESFWSVIKSMNNFTLLKCLHIAHGYVNSRCSFKWKIKVSNRIDSFVFLAPDSICHNSSKELLHVIGNGQEVEEKEVNKNFIAWECLTDAIVRVRILNYVIDLPLLEKVSITDSGKRGTVCVSSSGKVAEARNCLRSSNETFEQSLKRAEKMPRRVSLCYVPLLVLPVSGYVMKGVTLIVFERDDLPDDDSFIKCGDVDGFEEDKEDAVYSEALTEIFKKHMGRMQRLLN